MKILGIDPGFAIVGYGVIEKQRDRLTALDYGVICTPKDEDAPVRLAIINDALTSLIDKHKPDVIAVEELFFNNNAKTAIGVAQARGVILLCAIKQCGHLYEYTPLQVKQVLTGNGRADKKQIQFMIRAVLSLTSIPKPDDAADALAVAVCHAHHAPEKYDV